MKMIPLAQKKTDKVDAEKLAIGDIAQCQVKLLFDELENNENLIEKIENKIKIIGSEYIHEIDILTRMKGTSVTSVIAIIADIAKIDCFPNSKHLT